MPLNFYHGDITKIKADAIVNAANCSLLGGGGVDGAIHSAAGPELLNECRTLGGCATGEAKMTRGYNLPAEYVIHTVGPVWQGGNCGEEQLLRSCYRNSVRIAKENNFGTIAFPLISAGVYGYPKDKAIFVACDEISKCISDTDIEATLVFYDKPGPSLSLDEMRLERFGTREISGILEADYCVPNNKPASRPTLRKKKISPLRQSRKTDDMDFEPVCGSVPSPAFAPAPPSARATGLEELINSVDEDFCGMLCRLIDEKGLTDPECYRRANISRKLFSKIKCNPDYKPEKKTVLAFAVALELTLHETDALLKKAGYAFSDCSKFDIIVCYYINKGNYNIFEINETLFAYDQLLLGSSVI